MAPRTLALSFGYMGCLSRGHIVWSGWTSECALSQHVSTFSDENKCLGQALLCFYYRICNSCLIKGTRLCKPLDIFVFPKGLWNLFYNLLINKNIYLFQCDSCTCLYIVYTSPCLPVLVFVCCAFYTLSESNGKTHKNSQSSRSNVG